MTPASSDGGVPRSLVVGSCSSMRVITFFSENSVAVYFTYISFGG